MDSILERFNKVTLISALILCAMIGVSIWFGAARASQEDFHQTNLAYLESKRDNAKALSGAASVTSLLISMIPDDTATPIANQIATIGTNFLIILSALTAEQSLLMITGKISFCYLLPFALFFLILFIFIQRKLFLQLGIKLLVCALAIYAVVPLTIQITRMGDSSYEEAVNETLEQSQKMEEVMEGKGISVPADTAVNGESPDGSVPAAEEILTEGSALNESGAEGSGAGSSGTEDAGAGSSGTEDAGAGRLDTGAAGTETAGADNASVTAADTETADADATGTDAMGTDTTGTDAASTEKTNTDGSGTKAADTESETAGAAASGTKETQTEKKAWYARAWDSITDTAGHIRDTTKEMADAAVGALSNTADSVVTTASNAADTVSDAASQAVDSVSEAASNAADTVSDAASQAVDSVSDAASSVASSVDSAVNSTSSFVQNIPELPNQAAELLNSYIESFVIMIVTTCILPILILLGLVWILNLLLSIDPDWDGAKLYRSARKVKTTHNH